MLTPQENKILKSYQVPNYHCMFIRNIKMLSEILRDQQSRGIFLKIGEKIYCFSMSIFHYVFIPMYECLNNVNLFHK